MNETTKKTHKPGAGRPVEWPKKDIAYLKKHYPTDGNEDIAQHIGTTVSAVRNMAVRLKLKKQKWSWPVEDEQWLLTNYPLLSIAELDEHLQRGKWGIINKYRELTGARKRKATVPKKH